MRMQKFGCDHYQTRQSPDDVRFTKTTIDLNFPGQHEFENIYDVLRALEQKILQPRALPSLRVFLYENLLWTVDNKLLYIYRISPKVRRVSVAFISGIKLIDRFFNDNSKSVKERMASPDFFPDAVRTYTLPVVRTPSPRECVLLPTVTGFKRDKINKTRSSTPKSSSSQSSNSSTRVTSRISSFEENLDSCLTSRTEANSPSTRSERTSTVRSKISLESSNNSSVTSYPVNANTMKSPKPSWPKLGPLYPEGSVETSIEKPEVNMVTEPRGEESPSISWAKYAQKVTECRDIPVSSTLGQEYLMETANNITANPWDTGAGPLLESRLKFPIHFMDNPARPDVENRAGSPVSSCSNSADEISDWHHPLHAPRELQQHLSAKSQVNQAHSEAMERSDRRSPGKSESTCTSSEVGRNRPLRLDRPLSSCGSSAAPVLERPSTCNFPLDGRKNGSFFRLCTSSTAQPQRNQSPSKGRTRAFLSPEKRSPGKLSREHELEVSKKILLKHMRKTFFSVY